NPRPTGSYVSARRVVCMERALRSWGTFATAIRRRSAAWCAIAPEIRVVCVAKLREFGPRSFSSPRFWRRTSRIIFVFLRDVFAGNPPQTVLTKRGAPAPMIRGLQEAPSDTSLNRNGPGCGERELMRAVLEDAIHCLAGETGASRERPQLAAEAREWL